MFIGDQIWLSAEYQQQVIRGHFDDLVEAQAILAGGFVEFLHRPQTPFGILLAQ